MNSAQLPPVLFGPMVLDDVPDVIQLEQVCFPTPWPARAYRRELQHNPHSFYWVVRPAMLPHGSTHDTKVPPILAYGGYWLTEDEAHIVTLATHPDWRQRKLGAWLLINMLQRARADGARHATLEVRAGNRAAQALYKKLGFVEVGRRKGYYPPTRLFGRAEDALLLTLFGLDTGPVWRALRHAKEQIDVHFSGK